MAHILRLRFDPNQDFQLEAIQAVVDVFAGLPPSTSAFALGDDVVPNLPEYDNLNERWLTDNLDIVQDRTGTQDGQGVGLEVDEGLELEGVGNGSWRYPSFTVEMETGTGKTYVYLRTIHELRQHYGFRKFVIVVPSVAIYEGVVKTFQVTRGHFASLYGNEPVHLVRYEGSRLSTLKSFATSSFVEILVMTLASFNGKKNVIYRASEQLPGERLPFQYIQETRPILILDEPQNMESDLSRQALRTLHPLCALRYSATHRTTPNLLYRLTPFDAYRRNLVKKIQVDAVTERGGVSQSGLYLTGISRKPRISASVRTLVDDHGRSREETLILRQGDDLYAKTLREEYAGWRVTEIHAGEGFVEFANGERLDLDEQALPARTELFRVQIERTIEEHMRRQTRLRPRGIKVLSLFFIDRVANYVDDDGVIRRLFDEAFERLKVGNPQFARYEAHQVRDGYFARAKVRGVDGDQAIDTAVDEDKKTKADRDAEKATYQLIMRDKERLLSLDEPVSFIFAHSALKEGWDNPNVFQICTLNQTVSTMRKRQEIGRGLRLAVDQDGERVMDDAVNVLTVVANESYQDYVARLQTEYAEDGLDAPPKPTQVDKAVARRNEVLFQDPRFRDFWQAVARPTRYIVNVDTDALVAECIARLNNDTTTLRPVIVVERGRYTVFVLRLALEAVLDGRAKLRFELKGTDGSEVLNVRDYGPRDDLAKVLHEPMLRGYQVTAVDENALPPRVTFANGMTLRLGEDTSFEVSHTRPTDQRVEQAASATYPVFNLIERAARETGLTRHTVNRIFAGLTPRKARVILENPEGFGSWFIPVVRNTLADHIVERMEVEVDAGAAVADLGALFPETKEFPQKEIIEAGSASLYDHVQVDSEVEVQFVRQRLMLTDYGRVICYFKFPPLFKVQLPRIVGNYNPDWGILRLSDDGRLLLRLVRETKGHTDLGRLQFPHERRKILAARKHFRELGVDYRVVTDTTVDWWQPGPDQLDLLAE